MIIATGDSALGTQLHLRIGIEVRTVVTPEDIDEYDATHVNWIINPALLEKPSWINFALMSRGAVTAMEDRPVEETLRFALEVSALSQKILSTTPTYVGHLIPKIVFVGERPNPATKLARMTFQPGGSGCGDFLFAALNPALWMGVPMGLMNAYYRDEPQPLPFPDARYVALGKAAGERLTELGVVHGQVDHPQYIRRFHYDRHWEYANNLLNAARSTGMFEALIR